jgi:hypothetical protein
VSGVADRYTVLSKAATIAYEYAMHYSKERGDALDRIADELLFLGEKANDLFIDFFFGSGRKAKRDYGWVRDRVEELIEELIQLLGDKLPDWERDQLKYWLGRIREQGESNG